MENKTFIVNTQKIEIPEQYRTIVIRTNSAKLSPFGYSDRTPAVWPDTGSVSSKGKTGLFGVLLSQDFIYLELTSFVLPLPRFLILEVDKRTISTKGLAPNIEVEFRACNVLFTGFIDEFFESIQKYSTDKQLQAIHESLDWKQKEIEEAKRIPGLFLAYIGQVIIRVKEVTSYGNSILRMAQMIAELKKDKNGSIAISKVIVLQSLFTLGF